MFKEHLDKLILRIFFCVLCLAMLYLYRYLHRLLFPIAKQQMSQRFYPSVNSADTIHYISRIIGFGIIFSQIEINLARGMLFAAMYLFFQSFLVFLIYLVTLAVGESIALYNFTYADEIAKRKNLCYGIIHLAQSVALALIVKEVFVVANHSLPLLLFLWLYASVTFGVAIKLFRYYSKLSFNQLVIQKNMALALSYSCYILGCTLLINSAFPRTIVHIGASLQLVGTKILLTALIFPLFIVGVKKVFLLQDHTDYGFNTENPEIGYGIYEGVIFLTSSLLTIVITNQVFFGKFYPA